MHAHIQTEPFMSTLLYTQIEDWCVVFPQGVSTRRLRVLSINFNFNFNSIYVIMLAQMENRFQNRGNSSIFTCTFHCADSFIHVDHFEICVLHERQGGIHSYHSRIKVGRGQGHIWAQILGAATQNQCPDKSCVLMIFLLSM